MASSVLVGLITGTQKEASCSHLGQNQRNLYYRALCSVGYQIAYLNCSKDLQAQVRCISS